MKNRIQSISLASEGSDLTERTKKINISRVAQDNSQLNLFDAQNGS